LRDELPGDRRVLYRAHGAQLLGEDERRPQLREGIRVEGVEARARVNARADVAVDLAGRRGARDTARRHRRQRARGRREIALVRDADQRVAEPEGIDDLGRARQQ